MYLVFLFLLDALHLKMFAIMFFYNNIFLSKFVLHFTPLIIYLHQSVDFFALNINLINLICKYI